MWTLSLRSSKRSLVGSCRAPFVEVVAVAAAEAATDAAATEAAERARVPPTLRAAPGAGSRVVVGFTSVGGVWCPGVPTPLVEGGASIGTSARRFGAGGGPSGRG